MSEKEEAAIYRYMPQRVRQADFSYNCTTQEGRVPIAACLKKHLYVLSPSTVFLTYFHLKVQNQHLQVESLAYFFFLLPGML